MNSIPETVRYRKITTKSLSNMFQAFTKYNFNHLFYEDCDLAIDELHKRILNLCNHFSPIKRNLLLKKTYINPGLIHL